MNCLATQPGSASLWELAELSLCGGIQWNEPDCERMFPNVSEWRRPAYALASPPKLEPPTTVCRGSVVKLYRPCAQGRSSELRKSANTGLQGSSRSRALSGPFPMNSATIGGIRFSETRLLRIVGVGTSAVSFWSPRYAHSSKTTRRAYGFALLEYPGGR